MNTIYARFSTFLLGVSVLVFSPLLINLAYAESIVWSQQMPDTPFLSARWKDAKEVGGWLRNIQISIEYRAKVLDGHGAVVACGSSVPKGTSLRFIMEPHRDEDIFWFATGNFNDSPYGVWIPGATAPQNMCSSPINVTGAQSDGDRTHAMYVVSPPKSFIDGLSGQTCTGDTMSQTCAMNTVGTTNAVFRFATTDSYMYAANSRNNTWVCWSGPAKPNTAPKRCQPQGCETNVLPPTTVPEQVISCPITVTDVPSSGIPTAPTVGAGGPSCVAESAFSITITATDPDGDQIRYGIDWDADGTIDQFVPSSGYIPSGTTQTASRTYATAGTKTLRVLTQDTRGSTSAFTTFSFSCAQAPSITDDDTGREGRFIFVPGTGLGGGTIGIGSDTGSASAADLSLRAIPSLIRAGQATRVHWSSNDSITACTVSAPNGDSWHALRSRTGGEVSSPLTMKTIFTLRCVDTIGTTHTKTAEVTILPAWRER